MVAVLGTLGWFALPVLSGEYNEGFQSTIVMNAEALARGGSRATDMLYALDNDFFWISRFGVSLLLAALLKIGFPAVIGFRLIMGLSLVALVWANAAILVRHYGVHPVFACLPALLFPGLFESSWFFNDDVLSAALSSVALALFWARKSLPATAVSGVLLGLAVAARTDAVLLAPAVAMLMWFELPDWRARFSHALVAAPIAAAVPVLLYGAWGLNFFDILPLTARATAAWARTGSVVHMATPVLKGFAPPGMLAMALGTVSIVVGRRWREIMLCLVAPVIYAAAYGRMLSEVRYLLPLTPFFGILMVEGAHVIWRVGAGKRRVLIAAFAVTLLLCFAPPVMLPDRRLYFLSTDNDMTRPSVGRFWSPILGKAWNRALAEGYDAASDAILAAARPSGEGVVVSTRWTPDRTVELVLREHGFQGTPATTPGSCDAIGEMFTRGDDHVLHLRPHIPMIPTERTAVTWRALGVECLQALGKAASDHVLVVGWMQISEPPPGLSAPGVRTLAAPAVDINHWARFILGKSYGYYVASARIDAVPALLAAPLNEQERMGADAAIAGRAKLR